MAVQMAENGEGDWNPSETNADGGDEGRIQVDLNTINWTPTPTGNIVLHLPSEYDAVLQRTGENDPALFIAWDIDTIVNAVLSINMNSPQNGLLGILGFPIVTSDFVGAIAEYGAQFSAAGSNIRNSMIAPNTVIEYCGIWCALRALGFHPYLVQLHNQGDTILFSESDGDASKILTKMERHKNF
ncbi:hypothetical protein R1sor_002089 [Riccia sorocarpa]|uniref:Uncharacterized protein n=1 Tax=Riccia sorocarpa TaxID=122646 RepID=A0ABD3H0X6_9MARC